TDTPGRVELTANPQADDANGAVMLEVKARDAKFQPLDNASVTVEVQPIMADASAGAITNVLRLPAEPSVKEPGVYQLTYVPRATGGYQATAYVTNDVGAEVGRAEAGWSSDLAAEEFRSLTPNVALLETLARQTGGEVVAATDLEAFVRSLPQRRAPVMETALNPVWHTPVMLAFALACLLGEWGIRRWK